MDNSVWKVVGGIAGIGGIAIAAVVYVFREIVRSQKVFTPVTRKHTYELLNRVITYTFIIGILGIVAYIVISLYSGNAAPRPTGPTPTPTPATVNSPGGNQAPPQTPLLPVNAGNTQTPAPIQTPSNANGEVLASEALTPTPVTFVLSSRVFDREDSAPIPGAKVTIVDLPAHSAETGSNGAFILEGVPKKLNERVKISVASSGYKTEEVDVVIGRPLRMIYLEKAK